MKMSQHENAAVQTNIKAVIWVTKYKQYFPELCSLSNYAYLMVQKP